MSHLPVPECTLLCARPGRAAVVLVVPLLLCRCRDEPAPPPPPPAPAAWATASVDQGSQGAGGTLHEPSAAQEVFRFVDRAAESGITLLDTSGVPGERKVYLMETIGTGVALLDYDRDGRLDVFIANGCELEDHKPVRGGGCALYRNLGGMKFEDVTEKAHARVGGMCFGALAQDLDDDGDPDLFVTRWDANVLLRNNGDGTFTDVSKESGLIVPDRWSSSAAALDYDRDGDLDLYVATYFSMGALDSQAWDKVNGDYVGLTVPWGPKGMVAEPDQLWRNDGGLVFTDVSEESGILSEPAAYGLGVITADFDGDGWTDVYVANDSVANQLFHNEADGGKRKLKNIALESGVAYSEDGRAQAGMGVTVGDYDRDGKLDVFVTNFALDYNTLYHCEGEGLFQDVTRSMKFGQYQYLALSWGTAFADLDLDGYLDLFVAAGHIYAQADRRKPEQFYRQHNMAFRNLDGRNYEDVSERSGPGLAIEGVHRGAALGDLDDDGDLDVVVTVLNGRPELLVNESQRRGAYLEISLVGKHGNRDAIGARVSVVPERSRVPLCAQKMSGGSFESTSDPRLHFGLGPVKKATVKIVWPSLLESVYPDVPADAWVEIEEGAAQVKVVRPRTGS